MKHIKIKLMLMAGAVTLGWGPAPAQAQSPVIASFGSNGTLVCTNLQPSSVASVEWAASATGPWTNSWAALAAVTADTNGAIRVKVPMFYRVRGTSPSTNPPAPDGMVFIPAGSFTMGDTLDGDAAALPLHSNQISGLYMDKYVVTKALWDAVYNWATNNGYSFENGAQGKAASHPAQSVSWYDAVKWCNARSELENKTPAYYTDAGLSVRYRTGQVAPSVNWSSGYRLPTEAEWEKAARGGASGQRFPWGDTISWVQANYYSLWPGVRPYYPYDVSPASGYHPNFEVGGTPYTSPVDYFAPNGYGFYDMAGNVRQWCWDWYGGYSGSTQTDPRGPATGPGRVDRGGGWSLSAISCRVANRGSDNPTARFSYIGFRSVLPVGP